MLNIRLLRLLLLLMVFAACNKDEELAKAVNIEVWGYNVGDAELETSLDTTVYRNFITQPNKPVIFSRIYTYPPAQKEVLLKMKDRTSGKDVFQRQIALSTSELELFFPFVFINGNELKIEQPAADPATNKLSFYIYYPQSNDALDIFLKNDDGQIVYIAQNVKSGVWIHTSYLPKEGFKDKNKRYMLCFAKTGTTDSWYFEGGETSSTIDQHGLVLPKNEEKGLVRTYFVTPGASQLEVMRLFKRPKE